MKILIAEDDATTRKTLEAILEKKGYSVIAAKNGIEALEIAEQQDRPSLMIFDWLMPGIDGLELCRRIRSTKSDLRPYIIMLTIKNTKIDIITGLEAGADDYLSKPYDCDELQARINVGIRMLELQNDLALRIQTLNEKQQSIQTLLAEKELILKEIHHRIKNNMNTIYGLLVIQAGTLHDSGAIRALKDAGSRVQSMMVLYDKLYRSADYSEMSVLNYLPSLIQEIVSNFPNSPSVKIINKIEDFVLDAAKLQPLGIIINELVTNIMKYAFTDRTDGVITATAFLTGNQVTFIMADNGNGMSDSINFETSTGFGLRLVDGLTKQLEGTIRIDRTNGTGIILSFPR